MRDSWLIGVLLAATAGILFAGCATSPRIHSTEVSSSQETADVKPAAPATANSNVRIVERKPSARLYRFVGLVRATSQSGDLVEAARNADVDLRRQAALLGADVVKLDVIAPPNDLRAHRHLIFAGRAYKSIARN